MFTITELLDTTTQVGVNVPWGKGATLAQCMQNAASTITDETDGMVKHTDNATCLALYMQHTGSKLVIAHEVQYVVRYGTLGSKGAGKLGAGSTVAAAMLNAVNAHNAVQRSNDAGYVLVNYAGMVAELLQTDYHVWVAAE